MYKISSRESHTLSFLVACIMASLVVAQTPPLASNPAQPAVGATVVDDLRITALSEDPDKDPINGKESQVGLNSKLWVVLNHAPADDVSKYILFLNDEAIKGMDAEPVGSSYRSQPALLFKLTRDSSNDPFWRDLLGSPRHTHVSLRVSLGQPAGADKYNRIVGAPADSTFEFRVFTGYAVTLASVVIVLLLFTVWGQARYRTTLRDNLLPQLEPSRQPFSLGRCQMAFWFTLIFAAFLVLFILLQDSNVVTSQALALMGISGTTAAAAIAVDVAKNSPSDDANRALQALGLQTFEDVQRIRREVLDREQELSGLPPPHAPIASARPSHATHPSSGTRTSASPADERRARLQIEINDRRSILRTYADKSRPFVSRGWFKDITTDLNGPTVHRLQVVFWTGTLGAIFLYSVYRNLAMPEFNGTLLTLMGISSAGYVGFKFQEVNN
jgi:hypothetical protein